LRAFFAIFLATSNRRGFCILLFHFPSFSNFPPEEASENISPLRPRESLQSIRAEKIIGTQLCPGAGKMYWASTVPGLVRAPRNANQAQNSSERAFPHAGNAAIVFAKPGTSLCGTGLLGACSGGDGFRTSHLPRGFGTSRVRSTANHGRPRLQTPVITRSTDDGVHVLG